MSLLPEHQWRIQQFYYREARLLDERQFQQWLALLSEDVVYRMPARHVPLADHALRGTEAFHATAPEWGAAGDVPLREENIFTLAIRVDRALKPNAWAENPPPCTRRFISNIEPQATDTAGEWQVYSHFLLAFSRHGQEPCLYTGQRIDRLREAREGFRIAVRDIRLDATVIRAPTVGLFF